MESKDGKQRSDSKGQIKDARMVIVTPRRPPRAYAQVRHCSRPPAPQTPRTSRRPRPHDDAWASPPYRCSRHDSSSLGGGGSSSRRRSPDLIAAVEQHVELGVAGRAAFAHGGAPHGLDVLALELKKLRGRLCDRLSCLGLGFAADWFACGYVSEKGKHPTERWPTPRADAS